jgi:hypothetical protein
MEFIFIIGFSISNIVLSFKKNFFGIQETVETIK